MKQRHEIIDEALRIRAEIMQIFMSHGFQHCVGEEASPAAKAGQTDSDLNSLRVKVAELHGWTHIEKSGPYNTLLGVHPLYGGPKRLPDYPRDLNACAEFEKGLAKDHRFFYISFLLKECGHNHTWSWGKESFDLATATAEQRCRAFVAVMEHKANFEATDRNTIT